MGKPRISSAKRTSELRRGPGGTKGGPVGVTRYFLFGKVGDNSQLTEKKLSGAM